MSKRHPDTSAPRHLVPEPGAGVAAAAAGLLAEADRAVSELHSEAEHAAVEDLHIAVDAELRHDRARMAEISSDLTRVHGQLDQINSGIIGLQSHSLRQTGVAALGLAVLLAIAWKVIAG